MNNWTAHEAEYASLLEKMQGIASKNGLVLNPDKERIEKVLGLMTENLVATGKPYCPCKQSHPLDPSKDKTCTCPEWKEEIAADGHCFCRLFYAGEGS
ncbi:ferredoxin:thioredoxin reductase [Candidatus Fermentibacteria bacterium]|nr:ferredoxin:thioredoxin reductase [Candidatus Fermentibacteria bacterium]